LFVSFSDCKYTIFLLIIEFFFFDIIGNPKNLRIFAAENNK